MTKGLIFPRMVPASLFSLMLGEIGGATATQLSRQALADEEPDIREIAAGYLATLSSPVQ